MSSKGEEYLMSAGAFVKSKYAASYGAGDQIHPIRVQPETVSLTVNSIANTAPSGAVTNPISAVSSLGKRQKGLKPRMINLRAPATGQPTGYLALGLTSVPALNESIYDAAAVATDSTTVSYNNVSGYTVVSVSSEEAR